jgi:hypothetical protein
MKRIRLDAVERILGDLDARFKYLAFENFPRAFVHGVAVRIRDAVTTLERMRHDEYTYAGDIEELALQVGALAIDVTMLEIMMERGE